jgi:hypothetical protein
VGKQSVRRVAIVGPGLDFTDKAEGFAFYPQQTIQPFALVDSLGRFDLGQPDIIRVTTLDLSPRVNGHLESTRARAVRGEPYVVQLPLTQDDPKHQWHPDLVAYWQRFGNQIGVEAPPYPSPAASIRMRAVSVRPAVTLSIAPQDLNIIVQRLAPLPDAARFDPDRRDQHPRLLRRLRPGPRAGKHHEDAPPGRLLHHQLRRCAGPTAGSVREYCDVRFLRPSRERRHALLLPAPVGTSA